MSKFNALENPWDTSISVSVETVSQQISNLESEELSREGLIQAVTGLFGNVFNTLRLSVNEVFKVQDAQLSLNHSLYGKINTKALNSNYSELMDREVPAPAGIKGTFVDYAKESNELASTILKVPSLVEQLRADVGRIVSTKDGLRDVTLFNDSFYTKAENELDAALKNLTKVRTKDDYSAIRAYGDLFRNNNELVTAVSLTNTNNQAYNVIDRKKLMASVESTMGYVRTLNEIAKRDGFNKQLLIKIGKAVSVVARYVEAYSSAFYNQKMQNETLDSIVTEINELVK